jgi:SAM-dependent methyltransferase
MPRTLWPENIPVFDWPFDETGFECFKNRYRDERGLIDDAKLTEYFISEQFLQFRDADIGIDVAAQDCPFAEYLRKTYGSRTFRQDLYYMKPGVRGWDIGGSASALPFLDNTVAAIMLHNSLEHFEGEQDSLFIKEAERILRPRGCVCIVPFFISEKYNEDHEAGWLDEHGIKHLWGVGARFSRSYDVEQFQQRILNVAPKLYPAVYYTSRINPCFLVLTKQSCN